MLKKCPKCGRILQDSEFAPKTKMCKTCRRDYDWQYRYGVSPEQYFEIYKAQDGKCKICGYEPKGNEYLHIEPSNSQFNDKIKLCLL